MANAVTLVFWLDNLDGRNQGWCWWFIHLVTVELCLEFSEMGGYPKWKGECFWNGEGEGLNPSTNYGLSSNIVPVSTLDFRHLISNASTFPFLSSRNCFSSLSIVGVLTSQTLLEVTKRLHHKLRFVYYDHSSQ